MKEGSKKGENEGMKEYHGTAGALDLESGTADLSQEGRRGLAEIIAYLQDYAKQQGYRPLSFLINMAHFDW